MAKYTKDNRFEIPDPTPIELPVGFEHPEPLEEMIARMIRVAGQNAGREGFETFEEADDFDVDDEETIESEYQLKEMKDEYPVRAGHGDGKKVSDGTAASGEKRERSEKKEKKEKSPKPVAPVVEREGEVEAQ